MTNMDYEARFLLDTSDAEANAQHLGISLDRILSKGKEAPPTEFTERTKAISGMNVAAQQTARQGILQLSESVNKFLQTTSEGRAITEPFFAGTDKAGQAVMKTWDGLNRKQVAALDTADRARYEFNRFASDFGEFGRRGRITQESIEGIGTRLASLPAINQQVSSAMRPVAAGLQTYQNLMGRAATETTKQRLAMSGLRAVSVEQALMYQKLQSAAMGYMLGSNLATANLRGAMFTLVFARTALPGIMLGVAALTAAVVVMTAAWTAFKAVITSALDASIKWGDQAQRMASFFQSAAVGAKIMGQAMAESIKTGLNPSDLADAMQTLEKLRLNQQSYRDAIENTAVANGQSVASVAKDFYDLYTTQRFSYKEVAQAFHEFALKYNLSLGIGSDAATVAAAMNKRYMDSVADSAKTTAGALRIITNSWGQFKVMVGQIAEGYLKPVLALVLGFMGALIKGFGEAVHAAQGTGELQRSTQNFAQTMANLLPLVERFGYMLGYVLFKVILAVAQAVKIMADAFLAFWGRIKPLRDALTNMVTAFKDVHLNGLLPIEVTITRFITNLFPKFGEALKGLGDNLPKFFREGIKLQNFDIAFDAEKMLADIKLKFSGLDVRAKVRSLTLQWEKFDTEFKFDEFFQNMFDRAGASVARQGVKFRDAITAPFRGLTLDSVGESIGKALDEAVLKLPERLYQSITHLKFNVRIPAGDIQAQIELWAESLGKVTFTSIGKALLKGAAEGLAWFAVNIIGDVLINMTSFADKVKENMHISLSHGLDAAFIAVLAGASGGVALLVGGIFAGLELAIDHFAPGFSKALNDSITRAFTDTFRTLMASVQDYGEALGTLIDGILSRDTGKIGEGISKFGKAVIGQGEAQQRNGALLKYQAQPGARTPGNADDNADAMIPIARAGGGSVWSGHPYLVGEKRPELFVPSQSGTILPNAGMAGGGGGDVNITLDLTGAVISSDAAINKLADAVSARIADRIGGTHRMSLHRGGR